MIVEAYLKRISKDKPYEVYSGIETIKTDKKHYILYSEDNEETAVYLCIKDFDIKVFRFAGEETHNRRIILDDLKRLINPDTKIFLYVLECGDVVHIYNGTFKDMPYKYLMLPVSGICPSSKKLLDIEVGIMILDKDLFVKEFIEEGVEQYVKDNASND